MSDNLGSLKSMAQRKRLLALAFVLVLLAAFGGLWWLLAGGASASGTRALGPDSGALHARIEGFAPAAVPIEIKPGVTNRVEVAL